MDAQGARGALGAQGALGVQGAAMPVSGTATGWHEADCRDENSTEGGWAQIHKGLVELAGQQAELDYEQGLLLLAALREGVPARLGYGRVEIRRGQILTPPTHANA